MAFAGVSVYGINPHAAELLGDGRYPDVALPKRPDGLVIVTRTAIAEDLVRQCVKAGSPASGCTACWAPRPHLFKDLAAKIGSVSPEAVRLCRENGIEVIPGSCPMQFLGEDFRHTCMQGILRMTGVLEVSEGVGLAAA